MKIIYSLILCGVFGGIVGILLTGCQPKKTTATGGALNPDTIPDRLPKDRQPGQKLSGAQMDKLRSLLAKTVLLPDSVLFLDPTDESARDQKLRQARIDNLPAATKTVYQNILSRCTPNHTKSASGEFVKNGVQTVGYKENLDGSNCPVKVARERNRNIKWISVENSSATGLINSSHRTALKVIDNGLASNSSITQIASASKSNGVLKTSAKKITHYLITNLEREVMVNGEGPMGAQARVELLENTENEITLREEVTDLKIRTKGFQFNIWYYTKHSETQLLEESMYINNEPVVADDFRDFLKGSF